MAVKGYKARVFINEFDLSLMTTQFVVENAVNPIAYNVLQSNATSKIAGLSNQSFGLNGIWTNYGTGTMEKLSIDNLQTDSAKVCYMVETVPPIGGMIDGSFPSSYNISTPIENLLTLQAKWEKTDSLCQGYFLLNKVTLSATGNQSGVDFLSVGSAGGKAYLIISAIAGTATNAQIKIQSDDNALFSSAADEGTFTFSAVGVFELDLTGTVDRYLRANVVTLGGATSFVATLIIGINGVTQ